MSKNVISRIKENCKFLKKLPMYVTLVNSSSELKCLKIARMYLLIVLEDDPDYKTAGLYNYFPAFKNYIENFKNRFKNQNVITKDYIDETHPLIPLFYSYYVSVTSIFAKLLPLGNFLEPELSEEIVQYLSEHDQDDISDLLHNELSNVAMELMHTITFKNKDYTESILYKFCYYYQCLADSIKREIPISIWKLTYKNNKYRDLAVTIQKENDKHYYDFISYQLALSHLLDNMINGKVIASLEKEK